MSNEEQTTPEVETDVEQVLEEVVEATEAEGESLIRPLLMKAARACEKTNNFGKAADLDALVDEILKWSPVRTKKRLEDSRD